MSMLTALLPGFHHVQVSCLSPYFPLPSAITMAYPVTPTLVLSPAFLGHTLLLQIASLQRIHHVSVAVLLQINCCIAADQLQV